jgi:hypothetical protein
VSAKGLAGLTDQHTCVVDLAAARINSLQQLIDFLVGHLLAEVRQDYAS